METAGFIHVGNRYECSRSSPTLSAMKEMFNEHITNQSQEPRLSAYVSGDPKMIEAFQNNKDIYATIASVAFKLPYEKCLEFNPDTGEYQADGKARRSEAKSIVLGELFSYAPSTEALVHRLLSENFVNLITQRCMLHC